MALTREAHIDYLNKADKDTLEDSIGFFRYEHLRMGGAYWTISALSALSQLNDERKEEII